MRISSSIRVLWLAFIWLFTATTFAAEAGDADARPIAGVVRDAAGKPVAEADVWLVTASMGGEAEVYDQTKSDASGKFRLTLPGRWLQSHVTFRQELGVVAYEPQAGLAVAAFYRRSAPPASGMVLKTKPPRQVKLRVVSPDGEPVAGAKLTPTGLVSDAIRTDLAGAAAERLSADMRAALKETPNGPVLYQTRIVLPPVLSRQLAAKTDPDGRAAISALASEDLGGMSIETDGYGTQVFDRNIPANQQHGPTMPETITLKPVGKLSGRVVGSAASGKHLAGIKILSRQPFDGQPPPAFGISGRADVVLDAQGRFEVPALAEGALMFLITPAKDSTLRARPPAVMTKRVRAGERTELEIPLVRGVHARGVVRERGSKRPLAGIEVAVLYGFSDHDSAITDANGRFACLTPPGQVMASPSIPAEYAPLARESMATLIATIPDDATEFDFPPIELTLLAPTRGLVLAEDGRPAPGAKVRARWFSLDQASGRESLKDVSFAADEQGAFALEAVDPDKEVIVEARNSAGFGRVRLKLKDLQDGEIKVPLRAEDLIALGGRAIDPAGKPISGAAIEIWTMPQAIEDRALPKERVKFDGEAEIRTDGEGRFQTPRELDRGSFYAARLVVPGRESVEKPWHAALTKETRFDDLVVRRVTTLAGRVVDRQGRPVPEAVVFQSGDAPKRVETATDADGRFRLAGVMADPTFVFVSKPGFRFFGRMIDGNEDSLELAITRSGEPVERSGETEPRRLSHGERAALAVRVLAPCLREGVARNEGQTMRVLDALALADPAAALEQLEKLPPQNPFLAGAVRRAAAKSLAQQDVDEALAVLEGAEDPFVRAICYLDIVDALGDDQRSRKVELLGQASVAARQIDQPPMKVIQLGLTAERLLDLGQRDSATKLLREGETLAKQLPLDAFGGYARGAFAEELAQLDLPAALELMKGISDVGEFDRHHGNAAHELAAKDPAAAERLLGMLHAAEESRRIYEPRESWGVRVCYRMAPVDLPRARRLADSFSNPYLKAQAYGVMAQAIGSQQREAAVELIERAFAVLEGLVHERERLGLGDIEDLSRDQFFRYLFSASSLAGSLLPNVESVDPALVPEYFWRTVSFRLPRMGDEAALGVADRANLALAMTLARYDREVAGAILKPIRTRITVFQSSRDAGLAAAVLVDPQAAVEAVEAMREEKPNCLLRAELAQLLVLEGEPLWRKLHNLLGLWAIDVEDVF